MIKKILAKISVALLKYCPDKDLESEKMRREFTHLYLCGKISALELQEIFEDLEL